MAQLSECGTDIAADDVLELLAGHLSSEPFARDFLPKALHDSLSNCDTGLVGAIGVCRDALVIGKQNPA